MEHKRLALFDINKTIYNGYLIFPLADYFLKNNVISKHIVDSLYHDLHLYRSQQVDYETTIENFNLHLAHGLKHQDPDSIRGITESFLNNEEVSNFPPSQNRSSNY